MFYLLGMDNLITIHKRILPEEIKFFNPTEKIQKKCHCLLKYLCFFFKILS